MSYCPDHQVYFHGEINENCYKCEQEQKKCLHNDKGPNKLFDSRKYLGLKGEWDECYSCGKMIKYI